MSKFRDLMIGIAFLIIAAIAGSVFYLLIWQGKLMNILDNLVSTTKQASEVSTRANKFLTEDRMKDFSNSFITSAYTGQQVANDYAQVAKATTNLIDTINKRVPKSLDNLDLLTDGITKNIIPATTGTIIKVGDLTVAGTSAITEAKPIIKSSNDLIISFNKITDSEHIPKTLASIDKTALVLSESVQAFNKTLPSLLDSTRQTSENVAGITKETNTFIASFNKPLSKKQRVSNFFLKALVIALPSLARR